MTDQKFNHEMLTMARQARNMTQTELSERVGTTQGRLSKIESGLTPPDEQLVVSLSRALDRPISFFYQAGHNYPPPVRFYRKRASIPQRILDRIHAEINIRALQIQALLKATQVDPELELIRMDIDDFEGAVEEIARAVRSVWRLPRGPIGNLLNLLERAGIICVPMKFGVSEFDAVVQQIPMMPPIIFYNEDAPADRLRFTLAHELGHLIMHRVPSPSMEGEGHRFAAEFLMPAQDILHQLQRLSIPVLAQLKQVWRVSMAAILEHAKRLGALTDRQYVRLRSALAKHGYLTTEPAELTPPREMARTFKMLLDFHRGELQYTLGEIAALLHESPHRIREMYFPEEAALQLVGRKGKIARRA
jgi:Zn-dependent peptidase ImmA (M78 family)/DNA-binding XRE family transcriptional regulator